MAYTPIEIIAMVFAIGYILKLITLLFAEEVKMKAINWWAKNKIIAMAIYIIAVLIIGNYILISIGIVKVAAVMLFTLALIGITLMAADAKTIVRLGKEMIDKNMLKRMWFPLLIWLALAIWVLAALFS